MVDYLAEAFKALDDVEEITPCLHEEMFTVDSDGLSELADFEVESKKSEDKKRVIDPEAKNEEELKSSYVGKVIIDCNQCHSKIYKDKEDIVIDGDDANKEEECPYCFATEGFKVVGEVAPYTEAKIDVGVEGKDKLKESIRGRRDKRRSRAGGYFEKGSKSWHDRIKKKPRISVLSSEKPTTPKINTTQKKRKKGKTIKDWYIKTYPTDELGEMIDENVTFDDVFTGLKNHKDFYEMVGVGDSIVRERVFSELAKSKNVSYDEIYRLWLDESVDGHKSFRKGKLTESDREGRRNTRRIDRKINSLKDYKFVGDLGDDLSESLEEVEVKTDTDKIKISSETITKDEEMAIPVTDDTKEEIVADSEKEDTDGDFEEFDEESFDELSESYLKKVYNNVDGYKTSNVSFNKSGLCVEGIISFKSGNKKNTQFVFESRDNGKRFVGENKQITRGKKAFTVRGDIKDGKFITESFNYRYSAINPQTGKSENLYETLKRGK